MKFDVLASRINENFVPEMARPKNLAFQKWKEENPGVPTYKFFKQQRELKKGSPLSAEPSVSKDAPETATTTDILSKDPATERTRLAVTDFLSHNPNASVDEVIDAIAIDSSEETPLNLDPAVVKAIIDQETPTVGSEVEEPSAATLKRDELAAKYDRIRQKLLKARGLSAKSGRRPSVKDVEADPEIDDTAYSSRLDMRDEPVDPTEQ